MRRMHHAPTRARSFFCAQSMKTTRMSDCNTWVYVAGQQAMFMGVGQPLTPDVWRVISQYWLPGLYLSHEYNQ